MAETGRKQIAELAVFAAVFLTLAGCANPWHTPPRGPVEARMQRAVISAVSRRYGNYCGYGRRHASFSVAPIDRLDAACRTHDLCYRAGRDKCGCDADLAGKASALARDRRLPIDLRRRASLVAQGMSLSICRIFPDGFLPAFERPV